MVRSALGRPNALDRRPKRLARSIPALSVMLASLLPLLPIVAEVGWMPDTGLLLLLAWRLLRNDVIPAWGAAPLGLWNDLVLGLPIGLSVATWTAAMISIDLLDRRTMWRDYWLEWLLAAGLLVVAELARRFVDAAMGASYPVATLLPPLIIAILTFPLAAYAASRIDRWRLGQ
ncbi:rod shape-determining protein MreD [Sphingomonas sp. LHG3406-1]|uniref:rod shape-determining protein MreD n=1 Tax=Sphingomonas sp. LHG3406-1 TaxID=2804617 RepID=UPI00261F6AA0|nr:rod shape-determining protein MreD [Sphingomonas sp. LHG3406-1]